jgi:hypothetical protein
VPTHNPYFVYRWYLDVEDGIAETEKIAWGFKCILLRSMKMPSGKVLL